MRYCVAAAPEAVGDSKIRWSASCLMGRCCPNQFCKSQSRHAQLPERVLDCGVVRTSSQYTGKGICRQCSHDGAINHEVVAQANPSSHENFVDTVSQSTFVGQARRLSSFVCRSWRWLDDE